MSEIQQKIISIIADELRIDPSEVTENAIFADDLCADSLDVVELVMRFEEEFDIEIPPEDEAKFKRVGDAFTYIEKAVGRNADL